MCAIAERLQDRPLAGLGQGRPLENDRCLGVVARPHERVPALEESVGALALGIVLPELRRLVRSLTAQGRMARWILSGLPVVLTAFLVVFRPEMMAILFDSRGGQLALVVAALMVVAGSLLIQRIVDIKV